MVNNSHQPYNLVSMNHEMKSQPSCQHVTKQVTGSLLYIVANVFYIYGNRSKKRDVRSNYLYNGIKISIFSSDLW